MSLHRNIIVLLTTACCALALVGPLIGPSRMPVPRPLVSSAPPIDTGMRTISEAGGGDVALEALRRQASGALSQLLIKNDR